MRSPDETTSTPAARTSSIVPPSTRDTYGMAQLGEYSMATRRKPCSSRAEPGFELVAARVPLGGAGKMGERVPLDGMDQPARLAGRGNQVVPAARGQMSALPVDRRQIASDGVQPAKVVQEPAVDRVGPQRRLYGSTSSVVAATSDGSRLHRLATSTSYRLRLGQTRHMLPADIPNKYSLPGRHLNLDKFVTARA